MNKQRLTIQPLLEHLNLSLEEMRQLVERARKTNTGGYFPFNGHYLLATTPPRDRSGCRRCYFHSFKQIAEKIAVEQGLHDSAFSQCPLLRACQSIHREDKTSVTFIKSQVK